MMGRLQTKLKSGKSDVAEKNEIFRLIRVFGTILDRHLDMSAEWNPAKYGDEIGDLARLTELSVDTILFAIGDQITSNQRAKIISALSPMGIHLWGDNWWDAYASKGATYRGTCNYHDELPEIYASSAINIHTNRIYHRDVTPLRIFDILACKGFLLAEYREAYNDCFEIGKDLVCFKSATEATELARYYLDHPEERIAIAQSGYKKSVERHSLKSRWETIIDTLKKSGAIKEAETEKG
jgi:spore maturation protein CgeB